MTDIDRDALDAWMRERGLMLVRNSYFADLTRQLATARQESTDLRQTVFDFLCAYHSTERTATHHREMTAMKRAVGYVEGDS